MRRGLYSSSVQSKVLAAAVTPLQDGGARLDETAFRPYCDFLAAAGLDGVFALGTTGEGILLSVVERQRAAELFVEAVDGRLEIVVHCGAQTTADTVVLAAHAAELGTDAVAVIPPPYYAPDEHELRTHLAAAAKACAPLPFFVYEFAARSGYAVPLPVVERLREDVPNLRGLKVSDTPWERFEPYLVEGLEILVGPEALIERGLSAGAAGAVSGLAAAFPEPVVELVHEPTAAAAARVGDLRAKLQRLPFQAALKRALGLRGLPVQEEVRAPLRSLGPEERAELDAVWETWLASASPAPAQ
jgi:dihydrodipicolinate synthase/N-acetylneuraminate lyase